MKVLFALPGELYEHLLTEFTKKYPEEVKVLGNAEAFNVLMQLHDQEKPNVVVFDAGMPGTPDPDKFAPKGMVDMIQHVRRAGTRAVLLTNGIRVSEKDRASLRSSRVDVVDGDPPRLDDIARSLHLPIIPDFRPPVLAAFSLKGGVGKSSLAGNLAVRLASSYEPPYDLYSGYLQRPNTGMKVLVWDLDFQSSDTRIIFNVPPELNLYTLFRDNQAQTLDLRVITKYIYTHPTGVDIFAAPPHNVQIRGLNTLENATTLINLLLRALQQVYHVIILDLPNEVLTRPHVEAGLRAATGVLHVTQPTKRAANAAKQGFYWLERLDKKPEEVFVVMNRLYDRKIDLKPFEVLLQHPVDAVLPEVKGFDLMMDAGDFPALEDRGYGEGLDRLVARALPGFVSRDREPASHGLGLSGLFSRHPKPQAGGEHK